MKPVFFLILFGVIGLVIGYAIFGQLQGELIPIDAFISKPEGFLEKGAYGLVGIQEMKQNILLSGTAGAAIGLFAGILLKSKPAKAE